MALSQIAHAGRNDDGRTEVMALPLQSAPMPSPVVGRGSTWVSWGQSPTGAEGASVTIASPSDIELSPLPQPPMRTNSFQRIWERRRLKKKDQKRGRGQARRLACCGSCISGGGRDSSGGGGGGSGRNPNTSLSRQTSIESLSHYSRK